MMRSVLLLAGLCGVLAGCSWGGGSAGSATASLRRVPETGVLGLLSQVPLRLIGGPLHDRDCRFRPAGGTCTGFVKGRSVRVVLVRITHGPRGPRCTLGHGPSPNLTVFCQLGSGALRTRVAS